MKKQDLLLKTLDVLEKELEKEPLSPPKLEALVEVIRTLNSISSFARS